jgi:hypothetical protein
MWHPALVAAVKEHVLPVKISHMDDLAQEFADGIFKDFSEILNNPASYGENEAGALEYFNTGVYSRTERDDQADADPNWGSMRAKPFEESMWSLGVIIASHSLWPKYDEAEHHTEIPDATIGAIVKAFYQDYEKEKDQPVWAKDIRNNIVKYFVEKPEVIKFVKVVVRSGQPLEVIAVLESFDVALFYAGVTDTTPETRKWLEQDLWEALIRA